MIGADRIALGILAGGQASRLGGVDKAMQSLGGDTLLAHTLAALPQVFAERLLSYNRGPAPALPAGLRIVPDQRAGHPGPLAALEALAQATRQDWLVTVPVDCRRLPDGLVEGLARAAAGDGAVARDGDGLQPLVGLWRVAALRPAVAAAFDAGDLAVHRLLTRLDLGCHDIAPLCLGNLNTPSDFLAP